MLLLQPLKEVSEGQDSCNENPSSEITEEFAVGDETGAAPGHMLTSSQVNTHLNTITVKISLNQMSLSLNLLKMSNSLGYSYT